MIKAVVIDYDDTLCLTEAACFELENDILQQMGRTPMSREIHKKTWGQPLFDAISERSPGVDVDEFQRLFAPTMKAFLAASKVDSVPSENFATLDTIIKSGKEVMILTSRTFGEVKHLLAPDHLLSTRVKQFYHKDNTTYHKPDPRVFDTLLAENNLKPEECVYVGDSPSDALAAKAAGMYFIASLESGLREQSDFPDDKIDIFIQTFTELTDVVAELDVFQPRKIA